MMGARRSNQRLRSATRILQLMAAASLAGCGGGPNLPGDRTWESDQFVYKTRTGETNACPDAPTILQEHFSVMQQALGFSWPAGTKVTYYKFIDDDDLRKNSECGDAVGCTNGTAVETASTIDGHELVHAYLWPTGFPPWLLVEGAAVALSCQMAAYPRPTVSWQEAFQADRMGGGLRGPGSWLTGFLLRSRPVPSFLQLYGRAPHGASPAAFAVLFEEIYGESLDDVWAQVTALEQPPVICPWECSRPAVPVDGLEAIAPTRVCGTGLGQTFVLDSESELVASVSGSGGFGIGGCGDGSTPPPSFWFADGGASFGHYVLRAGTYFFVPPADGATLTMTARSGGTWVTSACTAPVTPPPWADLEGSLHLAIPRGTWRLALSWTTARLVTAYPPFASSAPDAVICPSCDSPPTVCAPASADQPFAESYAGTRFLQLDFAPPPGGPEFAAFTILRR
jgi:hypothetical protein